jgi:hypothetical protein
VALNAVADCRRVNLTFNVGGFLVGVAAKAQGLSCGSGQLDASDIPGDPYFVAALATRRYSRVDRFPFALILMTLQAFGRVRAYFERDWMCRRDDRARSKR